MLQKRKRHTDEAVLESARSMPCCICGGRPSDASHIRTRGSGGPDTDWNVVPKCRRHHIEWGMSWSKFIKRYPPFASRLARLGWNWSTGKLIHPGLETQP